MASPLRATIEAIKRPTPRVRMATMLYETGTARTKAEAAEMAGITRAHFYNMTNLNPPTRQLSNEIQALLQDESVATSKILQKISRKAIGVLDELMTSSDNDGIRFRAAQDLADRGPETQKTQKLQVEALSLSNEDAKALAAAMVESARASIEYADVAINGLVEVDTEHAADISVLKLLPSDG